MTMSKSGNSLLSVSTAMSTNSCMRQRHLCKSTAVTLPAPPESLGVSTTVQESALGFKGFQHNLSVTMVDNVAFVKQEVESRDKG